MFGFLTHYTGRLKCDRARPCDTCVKRGLSLSCAYVSSDKSSGPRNDRCRPPSNDKLQERVGQLEALVAAHINDKGAKESSANLNFATSDLGSIPQEDRSAAAGAPKGRISVGDTETTWVEGDHWTAILDGIGELKDSLEITQNLSTDQSDAAHSVGPDLLMGASRHIEQTDIFACIPPRAVADRLVSQFLKSIEIAPMILHLPTFLDEYEHFWTHKEQTPIMWTGLLFAILSLALHQQNCGLESSPFALKAQESVVDSLRLAPLFRDKAAQCLILGNYTRPTRYVIEALLLYMHVEYFRSKDTQTGLWIMLGMTIRLALRMGYHRDGSDFPQITPFHAEMRRRIWCVIFMMDAGASAQYGLPRMAPVSQINVSEPLNLLDEDLHPDMSTLPLVRPEAVNTPVQYFVAKNRIMAVYGKIYEMKAVTQPPEYSKVLELDSSLQSAYENIPDPLVIRAMSKTLTDSPIIILQRIYVALLYFKSKCILHRPYLFSSSSNQRHRYSHTACMDSALEILQIQGVLYEETQAGGRLYEERGKVAVAVTSDFLLATTILCVEINNSINQASSTSQTQTEKFSLTPNDKSVAALETAHTIWTDYQDSSREARQAAQASEIVLNKLHKMTNTPSSSTSSGLDIDQELDLPDFNALFDFDLMPFEGLDASSHGFSSSAFEEYSGADLELMSDSTLI